VTTAPVPGSTTTAEKVEVRAVAFDLDGTLADTLPAMEASWNHIVAPLIGRSIPREEIVSRLGPRAVEIMRLYVPEDDAQSVVDTLSEHFSESTQIHARLYPGVAQLIEAIVARGLPVGVVTSMRRFNAIPLLTHFGLLPHFGVVVTEDDVPRLKPAPEPVLMTADGLGVDPRHLLVVGDNPTDMQAARAAGAVGGAAVWGFYGRKAQAEADIVLERPSDVLDLLP
jgi:N-acetyl-D-muramate 6-phosphate phosphatase